MSNDNALPLTDGFTYRGFRYDPWVLEEDENSKILHDVAGANGKRAFTIEHSPYRTPSREAFMKAVDGYLVTPALAA